MSDNNKPKQFTTLNLGGELGQLETLDDIIRFKKFHQQAANIGQKFEEAVKQEFLNEQGLALIIKNFHLDLTGHFSFTGDDRIIKNEDILPDESSFIYQRVCNLHHEIYRDLLRIANKTFNLDDWKFIKEVLDLSGHIGNNGMHILTNTLVLIMMGIQNTDSMKMGNLSHTLHSVDSEGQIHYRRDLDTTEKQTKSIRATCLFHVMVVSTEKALLDFAESDDNALAIIHFMPHALKKNVRDAYSWPVVAVDSSDPFLSEVADLRTSEF